MALVEPTVSRTFGSWTVKYEFTGSTFGNQWAGVVYKENGSKRDVIFLKIDEAEAIAEVTTSVCHERVVRAITHITCDSGGQRCECVCYDTFLFSLERWLEVVGYGVREKRAEIKRKGDMLSDYWRAEFRDLLRAVGFVHSQGIFHGTLNECSSYVFVDSQIKMINFKNKLIDINKEDRMKKMKDDLNDMGYLFEVLIKSLVPSGSTWKEKDAFVSCFSKSEKLPYNIYLRKVICHPFLMSAEQRMRYLDRLHHSTAVPCSDVEIVLRMQVFDRFLNWNRPSAYKSWPPYMRKVYNYRSGRYSRYSGLSVMDLLRFQRNLYQHFNNRKAHRGQSVEQLDSDVRKYFSGFLELVHQHLR